MGKPAAKKGDQVTGFCTHNVQAPNGVVTTVPNLPFAGALSDKLSSDVFIGGQPAAIVGATAKNTPAHIPAGGKFQNEPNNQATVDKGSATVLINGKGAVRAGDPATTCDEAKTKGQVVAAGTVLIGD